MGNSQSNSLLGRLILDVLSVLGAYVINFVGCDLIYHDFHVRQALKGSYWFILGPVLYFFSTTVPWIMALIKTLFYKAKLKIHILFENWWNAHDPFSNILGFSSTFLVKGLWSDSFFSDESIQNMKENIEYLKSIGRIRPQ